jgi:uncharacterized ubiquitin-like protein YukD
MAKITNEFKEWFEWFYDQRWPNYNPSKPLLIKLLWKVFQYGYRKGHENGIKKAERDIYYPALKREERELKQVVLTRNLMGDLVPKRSRNESR